MIKLIASDLDGTLLKEGTMDINPEIYEIIRKLKAKGIVFAAVSGREYDSIERVGKSLEGTLDLLFSLQMSANGKIGGGCPYAEINEDGLLKVWLLY